MKQLFASALLLLAPAWVMAQGSGAATPAKPASAKQATAAKAKPAARRRRPASLSPAERARIERRAGHGHQRR